MFWSALNWPIDVGSFCKLKHPTNQGFQMHSIGQYYK
jgi:hypothetical protein